MKKNIPSTPTKLAAQISAHNRFIAQPNYLHKIMIPPLKITFYDKFYVCGTDHVKVFTVWLMLKLNKN